MLIDDTFVIRMWKTIYFNKTEAVYLERKCKNKNITAHFILDVAPWPIQ